MAIAPSVEHNIPGQPIWELPASKRLAEILAKLSYPVTLGYHFINAGEYIHLVV